MRSAPKRKGRRQRLLAPPAIYIKKARLSVWLRHHLCEVVDSDLAPAAAAPAASTPAVISNAFVVTTVAPAAAPPAPAAAPPAAGSAANATEEKAASARTKVSFFISSPFTPRIQLLPYGWIMGWENGEWQAVLLRPARDGVGLRTER